MYHQNQCYPYGMYYPRQPGLVTLFGSVIGLGTAAMWSGARLVRHATEEAMWGSYPHHGREGRHHDGCGCRHTSCCEVHEYVIDCSPHAHCGCLSRGCC
jgi:hypothetical protein